MSFSNRRKSFSIEESVDQVDYKNLDLLKKFVMESGRIVPRRITNVNAGYQRKVTKHIKVARFLALMPYCDSHK